MTEQLSVRRQQRHLRSLGQQPLAGVEDVGHLPGVPGDGGDADLHRRAQVGVATVAGDAGQVADVLDACERLLAERPEVTLLSTHRQLFSDTD